MPDTLLALQCRSHMHHAAVSRWASEGGAGPLGAQAAAVLDGEHAAVADVTNAELVQLRVWLIALGNLVIALLAQAPRSQLDLSGEMVGNIFQPPGCSQHPPPIHAANRMISLVERADHFWELHGRVKNAAPALMQPKPLA